MLISVTFLILITFLLPGIIFRKAFFNYPFKSKYSDTSTISEVTYILIVSIVIHFGVFFIAKNYLINYSCVNIVFSQLLILADFIYDISFLKEIGPSTKLLFEKIDITLICYYLFALIFISAFLGAFFNQLIKFFKLDCKTRIFRFGNPWYYYLTGRYLDFKGISGSSNQIDFVFVDVLVKSGDGDIIYVGICEEFNLNKGGLQSIGLRGAKRRFLSHEKTNPLNNASLIKNSSEEENGSSYDGYYTIPSNLFIIPINESVVNINVRYFADDIDDGNQSDDSFIDKLLEILTAVIILVVIYRFIKWLKNQRKNSNDSDKNTDK